MKIFEVTTPTPLQEANGFAAAAGQFGKALGGAVMQNIIGFDPKQYQAPQIADQTKADAQIKATVDKVAQQMAKSWPIIVLKVMQQTPGARGTKGVTSFAKINQQLLTGELSRQIGLLSKGLTGGRYNTMNDLLSINPGEISIEKQQQIKEKQRILSGAYTLLAKTDPSAKPDITNKAWAQLINAIMVIAQTQVGTGDSEEAALRRSKINRDGSGRIAVDGRVLDMANPKDQTTLVKLNSLGLLP